MRAARSPSWTSQPHFTCAWPITTRKIPHGTIAIAFSGRPATKLLRCTSRSAWQASARSTTWSPYASSARLFRAIPNWLKLPGVEISTGSLGQGLSIAVGMALAARIDGKNHKIFCLMGDGEQQEGQVWEAAMEAGHYRLDNIIAIIDCNRLQIDGWVEDVMQVEPLAAKYAAFGWDVLRIDGHNMSQIVDALDQAREVKGRPVMILADTIKGKGVSFMENQPGWHGKAPNREELARALDELGLAGRIPVGRVAGQGKQLASRGNAQSRTQNAALLPRLLVERRSRRNACRDGAHAQGLWPSACRMW